MRFHLTTCFNADGNEEPDNYKQVLLHLQKFVGHVCTVDSKLALSEPLIPFDIQLDEFASKLRSYKLQALGQAILHSAISVGSPRGVGDLGGRQISSVGITERDKVIEKSEPVQKSDLAPRSLTNTVSKRLAPGLKRWQGPAEASSSRHDGGNEVREDPDKTEDDLSTEQHVLDRNVEGNEGHDEDEDDQFAGYEGGDGDEQGLGDGKEGVEDEDGGDDDDGGDDEEDGDDHSGLKNGDDFEGTGVGGAEDEDSYEAGSEGEEDEANDHGVSVNESRKCADSQRLRSGDEDVLNTQRSVCSQKRKSRASGDEEQRRRQSKLIGLAASEEAYKKALDAQSAKPAKEKRERPRSSQRPKKKAKIDGAKEVAESGDEAVGVDPRDNTSKPEQLVSDAIDTTRCFFLEYDDDGNAIDRPVQVFVDVRKILPNPDDGEFQYNHRPLNEMLVASIKDAMERSEKQKEWDINTFILAPVIEGDWHLAKTKDDKVAQQQNYHTFLRKAIRMTLDTELWNQSLNNKFVRNWSNLLRPFMCLATTGNAVWQLVNRFFDMWEKGELPGLDGVRPVDQEGRPGEASGAGPAAKTVKRKKELVHYVQSNKSPNGYYVCVHDPPASAWKVFGDFTTREKEMALDLILAGKVVVTTGRTFAKKLMNMNDLYLEVRRERYMVRMFNYVLLKSERRGQREWNDDFFIGYDDIMKRFEPHGLTKEKWEKKKMKLPGNVGGYKVTTEMYIECPYFIKLFLHEIVRAVSQLKDELQRVIANAQHILWDKRKCNTTYLPVCMAPLDGLQPTEDLTRAVKKLSCHLAVLDLAPHKNLDSWTEKRFVELQQMMITLCGTHWTLIIFSGLKGEDYILRNIFRWGGVKVLPGRWRRHHGTQPSSYVPLGNLPLRSRDSMTIVLHDTGNDFKKVTVPSKRDNVFFDTNYEEDIFVRCTQQHIGVAGEDKAVYGVWERQPARMKELCSWSSKEGEGVLLLGNVQSGSVWELLRSGRHVVACDGSTTMLEYCSSFIDHLVHNPGRCHFERPKTQHRPDRDMFLKLGKKRASLWKYLFCNAPDTRTETDYVARKVVALQHLQRYHDAKIGAIEIFLARCEDLWLDRKMRRVDARIYNEVLEPEDSFDIMDSGEDTDDDEIDLSLPDARNHAADKNMSTGSLSWGDPAVVEVGGPTMASCKTAQLTHTQTSSAGDGIEASTSKWKDKRGAPGLPTLMRQMFDHVMEMPTENKTRGQHDDAGPEEDDICLEDNPLFRIPDDEDKDLTPGDEIESHMKESKRGPHFLDTKFTETEVDILVGCTLAMEENIRNGSRQGAIKTSVAEKEGRARKGVEYKEQGTHEASVDELLKTPFSEGVGAVPREKTAGPGCGGEEAGNTKEQGEKKATTDEDAGDAGDGGAQRVPSGLGDPLSAANTGMSSHGGRSGGEHDAGDALVFGGASPRDITEPLADNRDEGDKLLHMVCTGSGSQIAPDSMEREEGGGMEGVRMTHGREAGDDDEEADGDANLEQNMDVDSEDGLGKKASCRGRSGVSSSNVINLIEQSSENGGKSHSEGRSLSSAEPTQMDHALHDGAEGRCSPKRETREEKEECSVRRSKRGREKKAA
ncbi:hypothetical protein CBR_g48332 [Chara braunii]|uniref:Ubiquitin-like protease family profile domain-containing protein n=1 Tax=Chara braunii TaxID=69332 RepID=A0A388K481_CHABU|nr:hypothetical protein CBR_g48332 [Chara braunii]|eukprot:GBG64864.1 hypothetical protein CBR_g48332 [Chara braunii]